MKKILKQSLLVAFIITMVLFIIDTVGALAFGRMPISMEYWGGDCSNTVGIGWEILHLYPMTDGTVKFDPSSLVKLSFAPLSLLETFGIVFAVSFVIVSLKEKKWKPLLIIAGCLVAGFLLFEGLMLLKDSVSDTPTGLVSIKVNTADISSGDYYMIRYPDNAYRLTPSNIKGSPAHTEVKKLKLKGTESQVSAGKLKRLIKAAKKLKENTDRDSKKDYAYTVEVTYKTLGGTKSVKMKGYGGYPKEWADFADITNKICKDEYLSTNPGLDVFSQEWFCETYGITEKHMPEGGSIEQFIQFNKIDMEYLSGRNSSGMSGFYFDPARKLDAYRKALEKNDN